MTAPALQTAAARPLPLPGAPAGTRPPAALTGFAALLDQIRPATPTAPDAPIATVVAPPDAGAAALPPAAPLVVATGPGTLPVPPTPMPLPDAAPLRVEAGKPAKPDVAFDAAELGRTSSETDTDEAADTVPLLTTSVMADSLPVLPPVAPLQLPPSQSPLPQSPPPVPVPAAPLSPATAAAPSVSAAPGIPGQAVPNQPALPPVAATMGPAPSDPAASDPSPDSPAGPTSPTAASRLAGQAASAPQAGLRLAPAPTESKAVIASLIPDTAVSDPSASFAAPLVPPARTAPLAEQSQTTGTATTATTSVPTPRAAEPRLHTAATPARAASPFLSAATSTVPKPLDEKNADVPAPTAADPTPPAPSPPISASLAVSAPTAASAAPPARQAEPPLPPPPAAQVAQALTEPVKLVLASPTTAAGPHITTVHIAPAELGRVEIRIERTADGPARIQLVAERPGTLSRLVEDRSALHQALDSAGLASHGRTVEFSLAPPPPQGAAPSTDLGAGTSGHGGSGNGSGRHNPYPARLAPAADEAPSASFLVRSLRSGVDITA